ncbi:GRF1-interacting factor 3 [Dionaea muscipula]
MQQPSPMMPVMPSFPSANITTEQIQKYLDENKKLILAILDNQNLGKLAECAQYQAQLQKNLMYLAAIADAQPQMPAMPTQMSPHPAMQQGAYYIQHPQAAAMAQQPGIFPPKMPVQFPTPQQLHEQQQLHQQHQQAVVQGHVNMRPGEPSMLGGVSSGGPPPSASAGNARGGGNKPDAAETAASGPDAQGGGDGE